MSSWNRKFAEVGVIALFCAGLLWWNPSSILSPVRGALWAAVEPVAAFLEYTRGTVSDTAHSFARIASLKSENAKLVEEVSTLQGRLAEMTDIQKENDQLRNEIQSSLRHTDRVTSALVIGYDARGGGDWLLIDKGTRDGVETGMTVVFGENILVGMVEEAQYSVARVRLISNPKSVFNAHTVQSQAKGVARGKFGLGILLDSVLQTDGLSDGDTVVTSELGEVFPPGLFVGTVKNVGHSSDGLFQQALLVPPVDFFGMRVVTVIINPHLKTLP